VDVLSFGGTKNGLMYGESIVVLNPVAVHGMPFVRKAATQLASKMRFVAVQFERLLGTDLWLHNAAHANAMAARLAATVTDIPGVRVSRSPQANAVFAVLPREVTARLQEQFHFYLWDERTGEVRWMCAFDTSPSDVDDFADAIRAETTRGS
jgi:threonine aldolase